jgi:anti-sigma regulatory factor (Ser/Thr protein kinase)
VARLPDPVPWNLNADRSGFRFGIADAALASNARRIFRSYLAAHATSDSDIDGAEIIFGELVANVARHAPGRIDVRLAWVDNSAVLEIRDQGAGFDFAVALPDEDAESTRGLYIVSVLGEKLSHIADADGNRVFVHLPVRRQPVT